MNGTETTSISKYLPNIEDFKDVVVVDLNNHFNKFQIYFSDDPVTYESIESIFKHISEFIIATIPEYEDNDKLGKYYTETTNTLKSSLYISDDMYDNIISYIISFISDIDETSYLDSDHLKLHKDVLFVLKDNKDFIYEFLLDIMYDIVPLVKKYEYVIPDKWIIVDEETRLYIRLG